MFPNFLLVLRAEGVRGLAVQAWGLDRSTPKSGLYRVKSRHEEQWVRHSWRSGVQAEFDQNGIESGMISGSNEI